MNIITRQRLYSHPLASTFRFFVHSRVRLVSTHLSQHLRVVARDCDVYCVGSANTHLTPPFSTQLTRYRYFLKSYQYRWFTHTELRTRNTDMNVSVKLNSQWTRHHFRVFGTASNSCFVGPLFVPTTTFHPPISTIRWHHPCTASMYITQRGLFTTHEMNTSVRSGQFFPCTFIRTLSNRVYQHRVCKGRTRQRRRKK